MYRSLDALWEGWTKNLALLFPNHLQLAAQRGIEFTLAVGGAATAVTGMIRRDSLLAALGLVVAVPASALFFRRMRKAHFGVANELLAPIGLPLFSWLLLRSRAHHRRGAVEWKGRVYGDRSTGVSPPALTSTAVAVKGRTS